MILHSKTVAFVIISTFLSIIKTKGYYKNKSFTLKYDYTFAFHTNNLKIRKYFDFKPMVFNILIRYSEINMFTEADIHLLKIKATFQITCF